MVWNKGKLCEKMCFIFLNKALTHVRLHPINTIKPRKKPHPFKGIVLPRMKFQKLFVIALCKGNFKMSSLQIKMFDITSNFVLFLISLRHKPCGPCVYFLYSSVPL